MACAGLREQYCGCIKLGATASAPVTYCQEIHDGVSRFSVHRVPKTNTCQRCGVHCSKGTETNSLRTSVAAVLFNLAANVLVVDDMTNTICLPDHLLPLYLDPSRRRSLSGNTLAQGTSSFWMSRPNKNGWLGSVRPSSGWNVGVMKSIPAWSLLPRKVLVKVTLSSSSKNLPGTEIKQIQFKKIYFV